MNKKHTANVQNAKIGITVMSLITWSKRKKKLLRSTMTESTSERTYILE